MNIIFCGIHKYSFFPFFVGRIHIYSVWKWLQLFQFAYSGFIQCCNKTKKQSCVFFLSVHTLALFQCNFKIGAVNFQRLYLASHVCSAKLCQWWMPVYSIRNGTVFGLEGIKVAAVKFFLNVPLNIVCCSLSEFHNVGHVKSAAWQILCGGNCPFIAHNVSSKILQAYLPFHLWTALSPQFW